jgi:hypothetical protein
MAQHIAGQGLLLASTSRKDEPGALRTDGFGRAYRYVRFLAPVIKGNPVAVSSSAQSAVKMHGWKVTKNASGTKSGRCCGIAVGTASTCQYGYVLSHGPLGGPNSHYILTDGGVANGDLLIKDQVTAGMADTATNTGTQIAWLIGRATAADSGSYQAKGWVDCWPHGGAM